MTGLGDIDGLIARGLDRYRAGDIDGALTAWEAALAVDPNEPRALGYVDYVRQNYDELSGGSTEALAEMLIPFGLARGDDDDGDDYEISIIPGEEESPQESTETGSFAKLDPGAERTIAGARAGAGAWAPQVPEGEPRAESID
ncbi:MAG: tetratricopeptide repeat protein, partial [Kofleriaceae bacterium]